MGRKEDLFYGYNKMRDEAYKNHKLENSPLEGKYKSEITVKESIIDIIIDHSWVEVFDDLFPYVENCIKELRSFLKHDEELINVQLANNIDINETLNYMTQHTDIIEQFDEESSSVTPGKLINIFNESTYDIYENRFVYTIVNMCNDFFAELINAIEKNLGKHYYNVTMTHSRDERDSNGLSCYQEGTNSMNLAFDKTMREIQEEEENLPDLGTVKRLYAQIRDWYDTELIRALKGVKEVSAPLTMTNVLQKNPNFQKAVILFDFISSYAKEKFVIKHTEREVKLTPKMQAKFMEMNNYDDMVQRYNLDKGFSAQLDNAYTKRVKQEQEDEKKAKKKAEEEVQRRIKVAVDGQISKDTIIKDEMEKKYKRVINVFQSVSTKDVNEAIEEFNKRSDLELEDRLLFENELRNKYVQDVETLKASFEVQYEAFRHEMQIEKNQFIIDQTQQLRLYDESHKKEIDKLNTIHSAEIKKAHILSEKDKKELIRAHKAEISALEKDKDAHTQSLISEYQAKMDDIIRDCENKITELTGDLKLEKQVLIQDYENEKSVMKADYEDKLSFAQERAKMDLAKLTREKDKQLEDLVSGFETEKATLIRDAVRTVEQEKQSIESRYKTLEVESKILLDKERGDHENALKKLIAEHELEISTIKRDADKQVREAVIAQENAELDAARAKEDADTRVKEMNAKFEQLSSEKDAKNTQDIIMLNRQYKKDLDNTIETYEKQVASLQQIVTKYKDDLFSMRKKQSEEVNEIKETYDKIIQRQQNEFEEAIAKNEANFNIQYSKLNQQHQVVHDQEHKDYNELEILYNQSNAKINELEKKLAELTLQLNAKTEEVKVENAEEIVEEIETKNATIQEETQELVDEIIETKEEEVEEVVETQAIEEKVEETIEEPIIEEVKEEVTEENPVEEETTIEEPVVEEVVETPVVEEKVEEPIIEDEVKEEPVVKQVPPEPVEPPHREATGQIVVELAPKKKKGRR